MNKFLIIVFVGLFCLPCFFKSSVSVKADVGKWYGSVNSTDGKNVHVSDSVSFSYDALTSTITLSTTAERRKVEIQIYNKYGSLIYTDCDMIGKDFSLNYIMEDEKSGEYDVRVDMEDGSCIDETIMKE